MRPCIFSSTRFAGFKLSNKLRSKPFVRSIAPDQRRPPCSAASASPGCPAGSGTPARCRPGTPCTAFGGPLQTHVDDSHEDEGGELFHEDEPLKLQRRVGNNRDIHMPQPLIVGIQKFSEDETILRRTPLHTYISSASSPPKQERSATLLAMKDTKRMAFLRQQITYSPQNDGSLFLGFVLLTLAQHRQRPVESDVLRGPLGNLVHLRGALGVLQLVAEVLQALRDARVAGGDVLDLL
jgi:hypothetical protein